MTDLTAAVNDQQDSLSICKKIIAVLRKSHGFRCHELCKYYEEMAQTHYACPYLEKNKDVFICVEAVLETAKEDKRKLDKALNYYMGAM